MENMTLKVVGRLANGLPVYDRPNSHLHDGDGGLTPELLQGALKRVETTDMFHVETVDFDHVVGFSTCVTINEGDQVVMAIRKGRQGPTPMVLGRQAEPCKAVTVVLKKDYREGYYVLITAFVGEAAEKEPWDRSLLPGSPEHERCVEFWRTHALIFDPEVVQEIIK